MSQALELSAAGVKDAAGNEIALRPKELQILRTLLSAHPHTVTKDAIADAAWRKSVMSDASLAAAVSRLRGVLARLGWQIQASYGVCYRLIRLEQPTLADASVHVEIGNAKLRHAQHLLAQRTSSALHLAIRMLRELTAEYPEDENVCLSLSEAIATACNWGEMPPDEGLKIGRATLGRLGPVNTTAVRRR